MLEVLAYKRYKKHKLNKQLREINAKEVLSKEDEEFLRHTLEDESKESNRRSMFKFLSNKKPGEKEEAIPPTEEQLSAINSKDEGLEHIESKSNAPGTETPPSEQHDLQRALSSLNLAVEKVGFLVNRG